MGRTRLFHFSAGGFGRPFEEKVAEWAEPLGLSVTLVVPDPVHDMGLVRRRRTRMTRPLRQALASIRRRRRVVLVESVNAPAFRAAVPVGSHGLITAFPQIFKPPAIDAFASLVNVHPSLLPYYRGPDPFFWLAVNEETRSGFTLHRVTPAIDAGPILAQEVVEFDRESPLTAVIAAAKPAVRDWITHIATGSPFTCREVDAGSIYAARLDYAVLLPQRRGRDKPRIGDRRPRRLAALLTLGDAFRTDTKRRSRLDGCRWPDVLGLAAEYDMQAWLWSAFGGQPRGVPAEVAADLSRAHRAHRIRGRQLQGQLARVITRLNAARITPMLLSSAAALAAPGDDGLDELPLGGLVLVVMPEQLEAAAQELERLGLHSLVPPPSRGGGAMAFAPEDQSGRLELRDSIDPALPLTEVLPASSALALRDGSARQMTPTHELLLELIAPDGSSPRERTAVPLPQLIRAQRIVERHGAAIDWVEVRQRMASAGRAGANGDQLWLAHRLVGLRLPDEFEVTFAMRARVASRLLTFAVGACGPPPASADRGALRASGPAVG